MGFLLAGFLAAGLVWVINRWYLSKLGNIGIIYLVPLVEEVAKTGLAIVVNAPIFYTHAVFGTVEGITDIYSGRPLGIAAGWVSYVGHMVFGLLSGWVYQRWGSVWLAILPGYLTHMAWNGFVMKVLVSPKGG